MNRITHSDRLDGNSLLGLSPAVPGEQMLANMRAAVKRGLPQAQPAKPHQRILSVAGGGPSLADTYRAMEGYIATINGSLRWLLRQPIKSDWSLACGVCDAGAHIADMLVADPGVRYYIASVCEPSVFDKLLAAGCDVRLWHVSPDSIRGNSQDVIDILNEAYPSEEWHAIGGGCTMGLRWINLGYFLGFRRFHLHGLDSSFRNGATHAYPDRADSKDAFEFKGRMTRPNFLAQVQDFFNVMDQMALMDPSIEFRVFGDGLLQDECKPYFAKRAGVFPGYRWPAGDQEGPMIVMACRQLVEAILPHLKRRRLVVQAGGNVGVLAKMLAEHFDHVVTYEPDLENMHCLLDNCPETNITPVLSAIGSTTGTMALKRVDGNCGAAHIADKGDFESLVQRIDDHPDLADLDLIVLDLEGYELEALKGAAETIARFKPVIVVEDSSLAERYGAKRGSAVDWLVDHFDYGVVGVDNLSNFILVPQS